MIKNNLERLSLDSCRETVETLMAFIRKGPAVAIGKRKIPKISVLYEKVAAIFNEIQLRWHCRLLFIVSI
ncbi:hypothetical protein JRF95_23140 [Cytobacillus horneckiae]|nr:hypothetical protein [Cytobacillus horneckiae]